MRYVFEKNCWVTEVKFFPIFRTQNATKIPFRPNAKTTSKSSHHEDYDIALTFVWFGGAFLSMIAQKLAILANPISTCYKVDIVCLSKNCS
jgi:hypothetical protein